MGKSSISMGHCPWLCLTRGYLKSCCNILQGSPLGYLCCCATALSVPLRCPQKQQNNVLFVQWRYQHVAVFFCACWCYGTGAPERFFTSWTLWFKELPWDLKASKRGPSASRKHCILGCNSVLLTSGNLDLTLFLQPSVYTIMTSLHACSRITLITF